MEGEMQTSQLRCSLMPAREEKGKIRTSSPADGRIQSMPEDANLNQDNLA